MRQAGVDLWMGLCAVVCALVLLRVVSAKLWRNADDLRYLLIACALACGTILILALQAFHTARVGLVWTYIVLAGAAYVFYRPLTAQIGVRRATTLLVLRCIALFLLVLMLFEPVLRYSTTRTPDRPLYLLVDTSGSMSVPDVQNGPTRIQSVWQAISPQLATLQKHFSVKVRTFDSGVKELAKPGELADVQAAGQSTDIVKGLSYVLNEASRKDACVVLISDGIDNTSTDVTSVVSTAIRPIHTLAVGSEQTQSSAVMNVAVESIDADDELAVGHESKLTVTIKSSGLANRVVDVKWSQLDTDSKPIGVQGDQKLVLEPQPGGQKMMLPYKPATVGLQRISVWIDPIPGERTTVDNRQEFQGLALDPRVKVLYIEGRARPEFRELKRALDRDSNIELASLLRIQQDRFSASGSVDGEKLAALPTSEAQWRKVDVIILGDLDASFLTRGQQSAIEQAVADGAGLLMVGGQSSFGPGSYAGTPIEKALPVLVGDKNAIQEKTEFVPRLTSEGALHPAMEGLAEWFGTGNKAGARQLPPIRGNVVVPRARQGATVLLIHQSKQGPDGNAQIVLAVQAYGKGRTGAFTADTTYLWYLPLRGMGQDSPYNRFWGQLVRWLAGVDVKNRQQGAGMIGMLTKSVYQLGETVGVKAMVRDERGDATRYANVSYELRKADGSVAQRGTLSPAEAHVGLYEMPLSHVEPGDWQVQLTATKDGKTLGQQTMKCTVIAPADELLQLAAKPQILAQISRATQGWSYPLGQCPQLVNQLIRTDTQGSPDRQVIVPLANAIRLLPAMVGHPADWSTNYDLPMQAVLVLGALMGEWFLRRRWQLS